jgi:hypothetical protein
MWATHGKKIRDQTHLMAQEILEMAKGQGIKAPRLQKILTLLDNLQRSAVA